MRVKPRRPTYSLCGIIEEQIQSIIMLLNIAGKDFYAGGMPQVESVYLQSIAPYRKIIFFRKTQCCIYGKTGGSDHSGTSSQHHQGRMVANFESGTGDKSNLSLQ